MTLTKHNSPWFLIRDCATWNLADNPLPTRSRRPAPLPRPKTTTSPMRTMTFPPCRTPPRIAAETQEWRAKGWNRWRDETPLLQIKQRFEWTSRMFCIKSWTAREPAALPRDGRNRIRFLFKSFPVDWVSVWWRSFRFVIYPGKLIHIGK